ncbi:MAG: amidase [Archangium sp.]|nr:amidase [Archangium sp.]
MSIADAFEANDALGLAELVRKKQVSPTELLDEAIRRAGQVNPKLNAIVFDMHELARKQIADGLPDGPFTGVPFLLKDLAQPYAGVPMKNGTRLYEKLVPEEHGELLKRYLKAGVVVFGKTATSEMGILPTVETVLHGDTHNPWKEKFTTGGSSGGAAAAVAARVVPAAHGGDAGGSIRIPASCCGVFGLKPTRGRNPTGPDASEKAHGLAQEHVLTLSVRDSAAFLDATAGPEDIAPYWAPPKTGSYLDEVSKAPGKLRIAYTHKPLLPGTENDDCKKSIEDAVVLLKSLGHECVEAAPPVNGEKIALSFFTTYCAGVAGELQIAEEFLGRPAKPTDVEATTWLMGMIGRTRFSAGNFSVALRELQAMSRDVARFMEKFDVYLTPTLGTPPLPHGALGAAGFEKRVQAAVARLDFTTALRLPGLIQKAVSRAFNFAPFPAVGNVTGQPSMSVPLWWNGDGLPMGVCFTGRFGDEPTLFRLAGQLEQARPWRTKRPAICSAP